ncbi:MAG: efflux RND transporter periplasmic adaptor subunit [Acidobacteria bacterium]|nr:efflux RND transporter periplasmic adaptor subunit [Acidobacteriota bacterium]
MRNCLFVVGLTCAVVFQSGCQKAAPVATAAAAHSPAGNPLEIHLTPEEAKRYRTGTLEWAEIGGSIQVAALVDVDQRLVTRVGSPVMGRIMSLSVHEGEPVHRGQTLATINSTGLSGAQLEFLKAISQRQLAQRAVERAQVLLKSDVIGSAELQRREAELAQGSAEVAAARDQLALLGMAADSIEELQRTRAMNSVSRVEASMDGIVMEHHAKIGQVVQPADTLFEIADLSRLWLVAEVPEQSAGRLRAGQVVEAEIAALPGLKIHSRLTFVSNAVNRETRTVMVRMELPNPDRRYKPAMLASLVLKDHVERRRVVPTAAVVTVENVEYLFVEKPDGLFGLRPVKLGAEVSGRRPVLEGIGEQERVVLEEAFHLNNERRRRSLRGSD